MKPDDEQRLHLAKVAPSDIAWPDHLTPCTFCGFLGAPDDAEAEGWLCAICDRHVNGPMDDD